VWSTVSDRSSPPVCWAHRPSEQVRLGRRVREYTANAPNQIASADSSRHRLSRYGDRQLNSAIYTITKSIAGSASANRVTTDSAGEAAQLPDIQRCIETV